MRTECNKRAYDLGRVRAAHRIPALWGAGRPAPPIQPLGEGTGGASGAAAPFGETGVSVGGSGLAGV